MNLNVLISLINYQEPEDIELIIDSTRNKKDLIKIMINNSKEKTKYYDIEKKARKEGWGYINLLERNNTSQALNKAIEKLPTETNIIIADPDTYFPQGSIEEMIRAIEKEEKTMVGPQMNEPNCWTYQYNKKAPTIEDYLQNKEVFEEYAKKMKEMFGEETKKERITGAVIGYKKKLWEEINGYDERFNEGLFEDTDFISRGMKKGYEPTILKGVFVHHGGYSGRSRTIYQGIIEGSTLLIKATHNTILYAIKHGTRETIEHITKGINRSITGKDTITEEVELRENKN